MQIDQSSQSPEAFLGRLKEAPPWVKRAGGLMLKAWFPGTESKDWEVFFGWCSAYFRGNDEDLNFQLQNPPARHFGRCVGQILCMVQAGEKLVATRSDASFEMYDPGMKDFLKERLPMMRQLFNDVVSRASNWETEDAKEFFGGVSDTLNRKRKNPDDIIEAGDTTKIYMILLMNWAVGRDFRTATELHQELQKMWGDKYLGDVKTIQKLCTRIGYSTCPPGRPRKLPRA